VESCFGAVRVSWKFDAHKFSATGGETGREIFDADSIEVRQAAHCGPEMFSSDRLEITGEIAGFVHEREDSARPAARADCRRAAGGEISGSRFADFGKFQTDGRHKAAAGMAWRVRKVLNRVAKKIVSSKVVLPT